MIKMQLVQKNSSYFLTKIAVVILGVLLQTFLSSCKDSPPLVPGPLVFEINTSQINTPGKWSVTSDIKGNDGYKILVICLQKDNFIALSKKCGNSCEASDPQLNSIQCPCELGTIYNIDGTIRKGNANTIPLKSYQSTYNVAEQKLIVTVD